MKKSILDLLEGYTAHVKADPNLQGCVIISFYDDKSGGSLGVQKVGLFRLLPLVGMLEKLKLELLDFNLDENE